MSKVVIFGGTGLVGKELTEVLAIHDYNIVIVSRDKEKARNEFESFDYQDLISFENLEDEITVIQAINKADAVINLSGAGIFDKRWTKKYKEVLFQSRIGTTKTVVKYISKTKEKPKVFICSSAVGYYGGTLSDKQIDEKSPSGFDFLAQLCTAWENEANTAKNIVKRVINIRSGIVLSNEGGALPMLKKSYKYKIGTYFRPGNQYFSWIHIEDLTYAILECIENKKLIGPVDITSPNPVSHKELSLRFKEVYEPLITIPLPRKLARVVLGEAAETLTTGQRVIPGKLTAINFVFKYPEILTALKNLED
ncbi:MAG: TIGR01777 family oxidoreductase [Candidatus Dojkabacteria bacterium]